MSTRTRHYTNPLTAKAKEALKEIGKELQQRRLAAQLTERQLALSLGITEEHLKEIELGRGDPTMETMYILCASMGLALTYQPC